MENQIFTIGYTIPTFDKNHIDFYCALVRTTDLFRVAKYIKESDDKVFAKSCRDVIKNSVGKIVDFLAIPKS